MKLQNQVGRIWSCFLGNINIVMRDLIDPVLNINKLDQAPPSFHVSVLGTTSASYRIGFTDFLTRIIFLSSWRKTTSIMK